MGAASDDVGHASAMPNIVRLRMSLRAGTRRAKLLTRAQAILAAGRRTPSPPLKRPAVAAARDDDG